MPSRAENRRQLGPFSVSPIGYGAMRLTGPNVFGPPKDHREAIALLREAVELGVDHIDTAQYYGPGVVNELIREALYPYPPDLVIASKVGAARDAHAGIFAADSPTDLRCGIADNLRTLRIDTLPVVNLRLMRGTGPNAYFDDQLAALIRARDEGLVVSIGLSNVTLEHLQHALRVTDIACVQNAFHLLNRSSQSVLDECVRRGIAFVPFAPLGSGVSGPGSVLSAPTVVRIADRLGCSPAQVALAWTLGVAPNVLLIPGSASREHLRDNLAATDLDLDRQSVQEIAQL